MTVEVGLVTVFIDSFAFLKELGALPCASRFGDGWC